MAEQRDKRTQRSDRRGEQQTANPAVAARRELVAWCEQHQLPVPDEQRPQSNGR